MLTIGTAQYFDALGAAKDAKTSTAAGHNGVSAPAPADPLPTKGVSAITSNRWTGDAVIVSRTPTKTSTVAVRITGIDARGFNQNQEMVVGGSDFTIVHNDLAPGEVVNFKVALKDAAKQVKFVKVMPSWSPMKRSIVSDIENE
jgi:hypothetical protein